MTNLEKTLAGLEFARNFFKARAGMATPGSDGHLLLLGSMKACANAAELLKALYEDLATHKPCRTCAHFDECDPRDDASERFDYWRSCVQGEGHKKKWAWRGEVEE